jgi:hypothetical protein
MGAQATTAALSEIGTSSTRPEWHGRRFRIEGGG